MLSAGLLFPSYDFFFFLQELKNPDHGFPREARDIQAEV